MKHLRSKDLLPDFFRTPYLPINANPAAADDRVADHAEAVCVITENDVWVEEKLDGANARMCLYQDHPILGNRSHILNKGHTVKKGLHSQEQFKPMWNWFEKHRENFEALNEIAPFSKEEPAGVFGEWLLMAHGVRYTRLPSLFVPFDLYVPHEQRWLSPAICRALLEEAGFVTPPLLHHGPVDYHFLEFLTNLQSAYGDEQREGVYVKVVRGTEVDRFKMVRQGFVRGAYWGGEFMTKNTLI